MNKIGCASASGQGVASGEGAASQASRWLPFAVALSLLVGCDEMVVKPRLKVDQQLRRELFKECMASLPAGPERTHYSDWDEVVEACDSYAYYQSRYCIKHCEGLEIPERLNEGTITDPARSDSDAARDGQDGAEAQPNQGTP